MKNFTSNIKSIPVDTLFTGFKAVIRDNTESAYVAAGKIGSIEINPSLTVLVYEAVDCTYIVQAAVMVRGQVRVVAQAEMDMNDM